MIVWSPAAILNLDVNGASVQLPPDLYQWKPSTLGQVNIIPERFFKKKQDRTVCYEG